MPIYEYQCQACQHQLEALQKLSDGPLTDCPECGKSELKKLVSAAGFRLKGGGWYETDFKTGSKKNLAAGSDAASGTKDSSSSTSSGGESKSSNSSSAASQA